ncbi:transposase [Rhizobium beringeri]
MNGVSMGSEAAFADYVHRLVDVIGHADRAGAAQRLLPRLMLPVDRKSVEPLAAVTAPARVSAKHQSLLHFIGQAPWVGRGTSGAGWRPGAAADRAAWAD